MTTKVHSKSNKRLNLKGIYYSHAKKKKNERNL